MDESLGICLLDEEYCEPNSSNPSLLNLSDYCLQSPILNEINVNIFEYLYGSGKDLRESWWRLVIKEANTKIKPWDENHRWLSDILWCDIGDSSFYKTWLQLTHEDIEYASELCDIYLQKVCKLKFELPDLDYDKNIMRFGELGLECHIVVCLMNNLGNKDLERLCGASLTRKYNKQEKVTYYKWNSGNKLSGVFCKDFLITQDGHLLTKGFLLMIKDICIGRHNVLCGFQLDDSLRPLVEVMTQIFKLGDVEMKRWGNDVYDSIKLLEPICSQRMIELGQKYRDKVPIPDDFKDFIDKTCVDMENVGYKFPKELREILAEITSIIHVVEIYGTFRLWGHPYITLLKGLEQLKEQTTMEKKIDPNLAKELASDLALKVLQQNYKKTNTWAVDKKKVKTSNPLYEHIQNDTWPTPKEIAEFGDRFHELPLTPCFEIPDFIDPSQLMGDKAHSLQKKEVLRDLREHRSGPVKTARVLNTFLTKPNLRVKEFLKKIDQDGFDNDDLIIGLKAKERELKIIGRFFALLTWNLRTYFVLTELLIKEHFIPLFDGITMADDLKGVISKMINRSDGQGVDHYREITYANHMDYTKWNNHQRGAINNGIFEVMGKFLGYPNLIKRTHEIFEKSTIYYAGDRSLLKSANGEIENSSPIIACWHGQAGGLEGLRQKGWTIASLLMIERVARLRNTKITTLAQGDNQIVCCSFKLNFGNDLGLMDKCLGEVYQQNNKIMSDIKNYAERMGLIIKKEETMCSSELVNYGKNIMFRGNLINPKSKRFARMTSLNNDCLPNLANSLSTSSSLCLSISHFDLTPILGIKSFVYFCSLSKVLIELFDPCLAGSISPKNRRWYTLRTMFLDPSLGGVCGMNLNRFFIRSFPDPITESLSFWKIIQDNVSQDDYKMRLFASNCLNPPVKGCVGNDITMLIENPTSLNLPGGLSPVNLLRQEIKKSLFENNSSIKNELVRDVTRMAYKEDSSFIAFVKTIRPIFPRLLSQLKTGTVIGIRDSIAGTYENSRTIRKLFASKFREDFDSLVIKSEQQSLSKLDTTVSGELILIKCTASQADSLRKRSWGSDIVGVTIPHPSEILESPKEFFQHECVDLDPRYITTITNKERDDVINGRGPGVPYLGSATSEGTSILTPWEKDTKIPFLKRVLSLRTPLGWFVDPDSNLGKSIKNMIGAIVGQGHLNLTEGFKRTGSAIHRYGCERQSSGGYSAISPCLLMRMFTTTDTLQGMETQNYDFMFQANIIFIQTCLSVTLNSDKLGQKFYHSHVRCTSCIREIQEINVDSAGLYDPPSFVSKIKEWIPEIDDSWKTKAKLTIKSIDPNKIVQSVLVTQIGQTIGFVYSHMFFKGKHQSVEKTLFPLSIRNKMNPKHFFRGLLTGMIAASSVNFLAHKIPSKLKHPKEGVQGMSFKIINSLALNPSFLSFVKSGNLQKYILLEAHKTPPSYPTSPLDSGLIVRMFLKRLSDHVVSDFKISEPVFIFSDLVSTSMVAAYLLAIRCSKTLFTKKDLNVKVLQQIKNTNIHIRSEEDFNLAQLELGLSLVLVPSEVRHLAKFTLDYTVEEQRLKFGQELVGDLYPIHAVFDSDWTSPQLNIPQILNPVVGMTRLVQLATGSHYKVRTILTKLQISYTFFLSGGDGSGGITSMLLRNNCKSRGIFNSLLDLTGLQLKGSAPAPPAAVDQLGPDRTRCLNVFDCWQRPNDLRESETWEYFKQITVDENRKFDLIVLDMEITDPKSAQKIVHRVLEYVPLILTSRGTLIYKSYLIEATKKDGVINLLGQYFDNLILCQTSFTSSNSSEIYAVCQDMLDRPAPRYLSSITLMKLSVTNLVFEEPRQAMIRASSILEKNAFTGVPLELIPPIYSELELMLEILGIPGGIIPQLSRCMMSTKAEHGTKVWQLIMIVDYFIMESGRVCTTTRIPSEQELKSYMSFLVAAFFSIKLSTSDTDVDHLLHYINKGVTLHFYTNQRLVNRKHTLISKWEVSLKGKGIWLRDQGAALNGCGRTLNRVWKESSLKIDFFHNTFPRTKHLDCTGLDDLWNGRKLSTVHIINSTITQESRLKDVKYSNFDYE
ncbi:polymerase [Kwatta virus]|uniref:RNA-directed RNA polymerase L n=2 Tax=Kwatta virus TaxID=1272945 RepID=A0A0D3R0X0_9RHAB|nr:polymerase [Kwatta virus]AJR28289.1 polymerase [Kwatta virus]